MPLKMASFIGNGKMASFIGNGIMGAVTATTWEETIVGGGGGTDGGVGEGAGRGCHWKGNLVFRV